MAVTHTHTQEISQENLDPRLINKIKEFTNFFANDIQSVTNRFTVINLKKTNIKSMKILSMKFPTKMDSEHLWCYVIHFTFIAFYIYT